MKLLLSPRHSEDSIAIRNAAIAAGWEVIRLPSWRTPPYDDVGAIYGETLWARAVASQVGKVLLEPPLDWLTKLPEEIVRRPILFGTLESLWPIKLPAFIKPADDKRFEARVYETLDWSGIEGPILVSDPITIRAEWRVWMLNGEPVTSSLYSGDAGRDPHEAQRHAELKAYLAHRSAPEIMPYGMVIDVGMIDTYQMAIIEANPCFGSGIYDSDPREVLNVLSAACVDAAPPRFVQSVTIE